MTDRTHHKMMVAMMQMHWRRIDPQWKNDPELCHAVGYEAGYIDAVAQRVEPRESGSGAGFESLPASPQWQGLTDEEIAEVGHLNVEGERMLPYSFARAIEAKLREKNA